jgi:ABC-type lipoprotein release transport system permease subunit
MDRLNSYFERWFEAALIRAIKTMAQTAVAMIGTTALMSAVDWKTVISTAVLSSILSMLTSLAGLPEVKQDGKDN